MQITASGVLQTAATIAKTTPTIMGAEIGCGGYDFITLFFDYVNGDETGLYIYPYFRYSASGTNYQDQSWDSAAGTRTVTANKYYVTASGNHIITLDVRGIELIAFFQGGTNDGTPTGTVAATYTMTGG